MAMQTITLPTRVSVHEAARMINCNPQTVYRWTAKGLISHFRMGRNITFDEAEIARFIRESERPRAAQVA